ncbi:MAG: thiamine-phosphate pyrophosphorylase [Candidatus Omnitrophota bacterium]|nr:thiamine-phosphate pyrophosphorylase [Candidatus Omnitrophota bacterium]
MFKKGTLRILDANFNRSKEGLRVIEDIFRFVLEDDALRKKIRKVRHSLDGISKKKIFREAILDRNSKKDLGSKVDVLEIKRKNASDILYINFQRVKESLRVMEEFFKIISSREIRYLKKLRYDIYSLEKESFSKYLP